MFLVVVDVKLLKIGTEPVLLDWLCDALHGVHEAVVGWCDSVYRVDHSTLVVGVLSSVELECIGDETYGRVCLMMADLGTFKVGCAKERIGGSIQFHRPILDARVCIGS